MISKNSTVLEGLALYHPLIEIWSGTVRVKRTDDLKAAEDLLPPSEIVSDGRKRIVRKDPLRPLLAIRKRVDRLVRSHGFPFMGGIAVPESGCADIEAKLPELEKEFQEAVDSLCTDLFDEYEQLEQEHPNWAAMLHKSRLSQSDVRSRCRFDVVSHRVASPDPATSASAARRFHKIADAALPTLLQDVSAAAAKILRDSVRGKSRVASKTAAMVTRLVGKLDTFSFLDPRVDPMSKALNNLMATIPTSGFLDPVQTATIASVLNTLSDPETLIEQGAAAIDNSLDPQSELGDHDPDLFSTSAGTDSDGESDDEPQQPIIHGPAIMPPVVAPDTRYVVDF